MIRASNTRTPTVDEVACALEYLDAEFRDISAVSGARWVEALATCTIWPRDADPTGVVTFWEEAARAHHAQIPPDGWRELAAEADRVRAREYTGECAARRWAL